MKKIAGLLIILLPLIPSSVLALPSTNHSDIVNVFAARQITLTTPDKHTALTIDYSQGVFISRLVVNGKNVLSTSGVLTGFTLLSGMRFNSLGSKPVTVMRNGAKVVISGISYGNEQLAVNETWMFMLKGNAINWQIDREYNSDVELDDSAFPQWSFTNLNTWKGGILNNGGMVWCKYLKNIHDTYGVHTGGITLWNADLGTGFRITTQPGVYKIASRFSRSDKSEFIINQAISDSVLKQRYNLSRFVNGKEQVFAPFWVHRGKISVQYNLQYVNYTKDYSRGKLPGFDAGAIRELLNTTARYGVVDNCIVGGNGWLTNWKCLHEPFFAQIGLGLDDPNYTRNLSATLDQERDLAVKPDGRVLSRWHDVAGDEMPGTYNKETGYYEAMWGYTIDSQTGYVINTCEQFDQTGSVAWLRSHQKTCEKALNWLLARDSNHNGIYEMMNNSIADHTSSDWLDIVWASYENAFVNAQLYQALKLWANCEKILEDTQKHEYYTKIAVRLKTAFNLPVEKGGFWSAKKGQYIYWRDRDGSIHGDNMVTPVNFAAIAFGLCDDPARIKIILDNVEQRMKKENLFHWPLCFDSFKREEVSGGNWPFPKYENGDIFPTWGYLGINAYANYNRSIAIKYIHNLLMQYQKDGLSSQRYSRVTQQGQGEDVLSGICTTITALYKDIYGIRPKWNRMGLEPNIDRSFNGTSFNYLLRDTTYHVMLNENSYTLSTDGFSVTSTEHFGAMKTANTLRYYHLNNDTVELSLTTGAKQPIGLIMKKWDACSITFQLKNSGKIGIQLVGLLPGCYYHISAVNISETVKSAADGSLAASVINHKGMTVHIEKIVSP